jgi:lysozyme
MTLAIKPDPNLPWPVDYDDGVLPIAQEEGCRLKSYLCPAGKWTCGWGETSDITPTTEWTQAFADQRFCDSLTERVSVIKAACTVEPTDHQLCALLGFAYNYGGWRTSQVIKAHNRGDFLSASRAFGLVNQFTDPVTKLKKVSPGLTARRAREAALYLKPADGAMPMPQAVGAQNTLAKSPIANSGIIAAGTGTLGLISQAGDAAGTVNTTLRSAKAVVVETLGIPVDWFLPLVLVGAGCVTVYYRWAQRNQGWV